MKELNNILLSGGSLKGICYIGFLKYIEELQNNNKIIVNYKNIYGISVGSIFGLLLAIGYTYTELKYEILSKNFKTFKDINLSNFILKYGIDSGKNIINWINTLIIKKGLSINITFSELFKKYNINLHIITTNLKSCKHTIFSNDTPNVSITYAIRMSIGLPFIFTAEKYNDVIHIDGCIVDNYPIHLLNNMENFIGIRLLTTDNNCIKHDNNLYNYIINVLHCLIVNKEQKICDEYNTLNMYIDDFLTSININLDKNDKINLIHTGYMYTKKFFENLNKN